MFYFILKTIITALVVAGTSEIAKRSSALGAILASLPLTSILALSWLYGETQSVEKVSELSRGIFWAVLPSLVFFLTLPWLLKLGVRFGFAMALSCAVMAAFYFGYVRVLRL